VRWLAPFLLLLTALALSAQAGYTIVQQVEGPGTTSDVTIRIEGNKMRSEVAEPLSVIVDGETGESIFLQHKNHTFSRVTAEQARRMGERLVEAQTDHDPGTLLPTGEKKMIGSYTGELYIWTIGAMKMRLWISRDFPDGPAVQAQLDRLQQFGVNSVGAKLMPPSASLPGLRLRTEMELPGQKLVYTILSVKEEPIEAAYFTIPPGYHETPFALPAKPPK
jgi:hypothetical protein